MAESIVGTQTPGKEDGVGGREKQEAENPERWLQFSYQLAVWFGTVSVPQFPKYRIGKCGLGQHVSNFYLHTDHCGSC